MENRDIIVYLEDKVVVNIDCTMHMISHHRDMNVLLNENEFTLYSKDESLLVHAFEEDGKVQAIIKNGLRLHIDGEELD